MSGLTDAEIAQRERYEAFYSTVDNPAMQAIERQVCGCDFGSNGWTTQAEADRIASCLELSPGIRFLDLGAGSGWPGVYLAKTFDCPTMLVDMPVSGLEQAERRARDEGISHRITVTSADAADLPFEPASFDAISHSDLLCCLERKRDVLVNCREVIAPGGRMAFTVISVAEGLSEADRQAGLEAGPEFVAADASYARMLVDTGWIIEQVVDISEELASSYSRQITADEAHAASLGDILGADAAGDRLASWRAKFKAVGEGLLIRELFVAVP